MKEINAVHNGSFDSLESIKVSPLSRAYTFSDSVYEVIPFLGDNIIAFERHMKRLIKSSAALKISINEQVIKNEIKKLINACKIENGYVYYQISRGVDPIRSHMYKDNLSAETFGYIVKHNFKDQTLKVMLCEDIRWSRCDIKSTSLLGNIMLMNNAKEQDCNEVIMHKNNIITEGGSSNIFFSIEERICTPELSMDILPGITRELLIDLIKDDGMTLEEGKYTINDLKKADSVWFTSSTKPIAEVTQISNLEVNLKKDHHLFRRCNKLFRDKYIN